jgi:hypothetical protein
MALVQGVFICHCEDENLVQLSRYLQTKLPHASENHLNRLERYLVALFLEMRQVEM